MQDEYHARRARNTGAPLFLVLALAASLACPRAAPAGPPGASGEEPGFSAPSPLGDLAWRPGKGLRLGDTGFTLGGYSSLEFGREEGEPAEASLDALSFFVVWDPIWRLHVFSELEFEKLGRVDTDGEADSEGARFETERLFGDFTVSDELNLRAGKFLTPFGRWNVIHAQPLVWTTSRPLVTDVPFDENTTGVAVFGTVFPETASLTYHAFGQFLDQLEPTPQPVRQNRAGGARLEYSPESGPSLGATFLAFRDDHGARGSPLHGVWHHLTGLDLLWRSERLELMGEAAFDDVDDAPGTQWGLYAQLVGRVVAGWHAVGRYEYFDPRVLGRPVNLFDLGVAWRPVPWLVLKGEYLIADRSSRVAEPGFHSSLAVLF